MCARHSEFTLAHKATGLPLFQSHLCDVRAPFTGSQLIGGKLKFLFQSHLCDVRAPFLVVWKPR